MYNEQIRDFTTQGKGFNTTKQNNYLFTFGVGVLISFVIFSTVKAQFSSNSATESITYSGPTTIVSESGQSIDNIRNSNTTKDSTKGNEKIITTTTKRYTTNQTNGENKITNQTTKESLVKNCDEIVMHNDFATESARYYCHLNPEKRMLAAFNQESGYNPYALGGAGEKGVCQLMQNSTNNVRLKNPLRASDRKRQAQRCVDKWLAVPEATKGNIWSSVGSNAYKKFLYLFDK